MSPLGNNRICVFCWHFLFISNLFILTTSAYSYYDQEVKDFSSYQGIGISVSGAQNTFFLDNKNYGNQLSAGINLDFFHFISVNNFFSFLLGSSVGVGNTQKTQKLSQTIFYKLPGLTLGTKLRISDRFNFLFYYNIFWERYSLFKVYSVKQKTDIFAEGMLFFTPVAFCVSFGWKIVNNWYLYTNLSREYAYLRSKDIDDFPAVFDKDTWSLSLIISRIIL